MHFLILVSTVVDKNGEELSFKKYREALVTKQKRVRTLFDEVLANKAKRIKIKVGSKPLDFFKFPSFLFYSCSFFLPRQLRTLLMLLPGLRQSEGVRGVQ